jgi:NAD(P)H-dependent FMN reductase
MEEKIRIAMIYGSAREGRFCNTVGQWVLSIISERKEFEIDLIDPREFSITIAHGWQNADAQLGFQSRINSADAFVIITPEYNHGYPAVLKQLIDSAYKEWHAKPVAFVSYGGLSGGIRAVEQLRQVFAELHAVSIRECLSFANAWDQFDAEGNLLDAGRASKSAQVMLAQLRWWAQALRHARQIVPYQEAVA